MTDFILKKLPYDLTSNAGLALVGQYIKRLGLSHRVDRKFPVGIGGIANSDILKSYLGLLVQGKNDFDAVEAFRGDDFFTRSLGVGIVPSCSTMRQRMDTHAASWFELAGEFNLALLSAKYAGKPVDFGALPCGYMAVDWDTFVMNNAGTQKEAVGRTYQGVDGYTPSATLPGLLGLLPGIGLAPWRAALGAGDRAEPGAGLADGGKADPTAAVVPCRLGAVFPEDHAGGQHPGGCLVARDRLHHQMESPQHTRGGDCRPARAGCQHPVVSLARRQTHVPVDAGPQARRRWHTGQACASRLAPGRAHH